MRVEEMLKISSVLMIPLMVQGQVPRHHPSTQVRLWPSGLDFNDYTWSNTLDKYWWSLRNKEWVLVPHDQMPNALVGLYKGIKGPVALKPSVIQEYQVAFCSGYEGIVKHVWTKDTRGEHFPDPYHKGVIHCEDEVEIVWELRVTPGVHVIRQPEPPSGKVRFYEPVVATFTLEVTDPKTQILQLCVNAYRGGRLVSTGFMSRKINPFPEGYYEGAEKANFPYQGLEDVTYIWGERMLRELMGDSRYYHRDNGPNPGEFITNSNDPKDR